MNGVNWAYPRHHSIAEETIPEAPSSAFWRLNESNNISPYQMGSAPSEHQGAIAPPINGFSDGYSTAEPTTYGIVSGHHGSQAPFPPSDNRQRLPVTNFPPNLDTSIAVSMPLQSISDAPSGSMSAPIVQSMAPFGYPPWTSYPAQSPASYITSSHGLPGKWMPDATHLGRVEEEMQSATTFGRSYS